MTWKVHPRELTQEVFADRATIDGMRLNKAIKDVISKINKLDRGYIFEKWMESRIQRNWMPAQDFSAHRWPWLRAYNQVTDIYTDSGEESDISNPHREKSYRIEGLADEPIGDPLVVPTQLIWSETLFFSQPAILVDWTLLLLTEGAGAHGSLGDYINNWEFGVDDTKPEGFGTGDSRQDMSMLISVDNPLDQEDRSLSDIIAVQYEFSLKESKFCQFGWPAGVTEGYPNATVFSMGALKGMCRMVSLYIPIHAKSRVRISVVIPDYNDAGADTRGWNVNQNIPWGNQAFNQTLTFLEPLEDGKD